MQIHLIFASTKTFLFHHLYDAICFCLHLQMFIIILRIVFWAIIFNLLLIEKLLSSKSDSYHVVFVVNGKRRFENKNNNLSFFN